MLIMFFACFEFMIWWFKAFRVRAEFVFALCTLYSIFTLAFCSFPWNLLTILIFLIHFYLTLHNIHYVSTLTATAIWILFDIISNKNFIKLFFLISKIRFELELLNNFPAVFFRANNMLALSGKLKCMSDYASFMSHVQAIGRLDNDLIL